MEKNMFGWVVFIIQEYWPYFLKGTIITVEVSVLGTILGYVFGFILGTIEATPVNENGNFLEKGLLGLLKGICKVFVELFRGTPMMVQAMVVYYGLKTAGVNISPFNAAVLVTLLNTGAYMSETVRAGINSVAPGQREGAVALGMTHFQTMCSVILPQAFSNILPEMANLFLTNLKMTSVLNVIGISELYFVTKTAANTYYRYFEAFLICGLIYFVLCFVCSILFKLLEKVLQGKSDYELAKEYM